MYTCTIHLSPQCINRNTTKYKHKNIHVSNIDIMPAIPKSITHSLWLIFLIPFFPCSIWKLSAQGPQTLRHCSSRQAKVPWAKDFGYSSPGSSGCHFFCHTAVGRTCAHRWRIHTFGLHLEIVDYRCFVESKHCKQTKK